MRIVGPVFGQIKQSRGFLQSLLREVEKVDGEWSPICTGHNLLKLFRFGVNPHNKARADGPAHCTRNFAEVVSTGYSSTATTATIGWRDPLSLTRQPLLDDPRTGC